MSAATVMQRSPLPKPAQGGPYTKAQFQNTIDGARNVKSTEEIEQLLRDYPAALELYRTGKYKVKVKCEVDVERVILVEKRVTKTKADQATTNDTQANNQLVPDTNSNDDEVMVKHEIARSSRSRTKSRDRQAPTSPAANNENIVQTASSSIRVASNTQPKVDNYPASPKEGALSITPPTKYYSRRSDASNDSQRTGGQVPHHGRKKVREYPQKMSGGAPMVANLWQQQQHQQQRGVHPYLSNPFLHKAHGQQVYMHPQQQHPHYQQGYYLPQRPGVPPVTQAQAGYPFALARPAGTSGSFHSTQNHPSGQFHHNVTPGIAYPASSFRSFQSKQEQIFASHPVYQSHASMTRHFPWPTIAQASSRAPRNSHAHGAGQKRGAQNRARSVDPAHRRHAPMFPSNFPQFVPMMQHPHARPQPFVTPKNNNGPSVEQAKEPVVSAKEPTAATTATNEKLSIRQLHDTFVQMNPSGRLPLSSVPDLLQRFGIVLTINDLVSAGQELQYNVNEPISARRLIHILIKLGRIAKSTNPQRTTAVAAPESHGQSNGNKDDPAPVDPAAHP